MNHRDLIIDIVAKLALGLPGDVADRVAQVISSGNPVDVRSRIADAVPHAHYRSLALGFVNTWLAVAADVPAVEVAIALRGAAHLNRMRGHEQSVEVVWTGPRCQSIAHRHTEQAILQVLNSACSRILLVSYAVYSIPNIRDAVVRAARRGVRIDVVIETPDRIEGRGAYNTLQALGDDVAACSTVYLWPRELREQGTEGRVGKLHVKCAVADGRWLFLSSANLTEYAFTINMELGVLITGGDQPLVVEKLFKQMIEEGLLEVLSPGRGEL